MKEGVILWAVFTGEGKAALRMDNEIHAENGKIGHGRLLSPDVPVLHEILTPDNAYSFFLFQKSELDTDQDAPPISGN